MGEFVVLGTPPRHSIGLWLLSMISYETERASLAWEADVAVLGAKMCYCTGHEIDLFHGPQRAVLRGPQILGFESTS